MTTVGSSLYQGAKFGGSEDRHLCSDPLNFLQGPSLNCCLCRGQSGGLLSLEASEMVLVQFHTGDKGCGLRLSVFKTRSPSTLDAHRQRDG